uniref:PPM-type phosphatase domain-containing protein n=1 Tax=Strigamia maritima TaxID=126957 RepID=T1ITS4_STRMM
MKIAYHRLSRLLSMQEKNLTVGNATAYALKGRRFKMEDRFNIIKNEKTGINLLLFLMGMESKKKNDVAGSTALVALQHKNKLVVANVGDSRGVMCDYKGNAIPLSFDHKPQTVSEHKRIIKAGGFVSIFEGAWRVAGCLAVSRALGNYPLKADNLVSAEPDVTTFDLDVFKPQFMILATDGLWDKFRNEEAVIFVRSRRVKLGSQLCSHWQ